MKKAIIIGASSGIGKELSGILSEQGFILGIAARRLQMLKDLNAELPNTAFIKDNRRY